VSSQQVLLVLLLLIAFLFPAESRAASYFINASGPSGDGSGSSADNAADASTPDKYRAINEAQNAPGTVIVYAPGTYQVSPAFSMFDGVTHQGAGMDSTIIKIADGSAAGSFTPMWLANKGTVSNFKFTDATIDLNATGTRWWAQGKGCSMAFAFSTADHCTLQRIKFINMGARKQESFPIFFVAGNSTEGNVNHNLVDSCIFTQPVAHGNTDGGLTCIMMADAEPKITVDNTNIVSNCQFLNLKDPEYSDLPYTQCCTCPVTINNQATAVDALWFLEPGSQVMGNNVYFTGQTVQVTGNTLTDSGEIALVLMHPNGNLAGNLDVEKNTVGMTQHPYLKEGPRGPTGFSIEQYQAGNPPLGNITVQNNTFTAPLPKAASPIAVQAHPTEGSGKYFHMASLSVLNNILINFPQDGKEYNVTANPAYNPIYTNSGTTFAPGN
jgi:hypothetical protein